MTISFTLTELLTGLLTLAGIGVLVALINVAVKTAGSLRQLNEFFLKNEKNLNDSLEAIPKILHNTEEITDKANQQMAHALNMVENLDETVEQINSTVQTLTQEVINPIVEILSFVGTLQGIFGKKKKKGFFKK